VAGMLCAAGRLLAYEGSKRHATSSGTWSLCTKCTPSCSIWLSVLLQCCNDEESFMSCVTGDQQAVLPDRDCLLCLSLCLQAEAAVSVPPPMSSTYGTSSFA
jgi:hypothetical protein